jgi:hypothetical protein
MFSIKEYKCNMSTKDLGSRKVLSVLSGLNYR